MIRDYKLKIPANSSISRASAGDYIKLLQSTAPQIFMPIEASKDGARVLSVGLQQLGAIKALQSFTEYRIYNPTDTAVDVVLVVGSGEYESPQDQTRTEIQPFENVVGLPEKTLTGGAQYYAENLSRKKIVVMAATDNGAVVWLSNTAGQGIPLPAGGVFDENVTGRIYTTGTSGDKVYAYEVV